MTGFIDAFIVQSVLIISNTALSLFYTLIAFARSNTGIMGSNPTRGMDYVCVYSVFV
jgi:hypothetical protein